MKDIIISVDSTSHKVNFPDEFLGIGYENLQGNLIFQFNNNFIGGQARLDISIDCESGMIPNLTPYENGYILPIKSSLLTGSNVLMQLVIDETSLTQYSLTTDTEINPNKTYYEKVGNDYLPVENPVVGDISQYYEANTPVFKTDIFQLKVKDSINAQETIPEQYPTWINTLNTLIGTINQKLGLVDTALTEMNNLNINVSDKVDGEVTITFTDKQGNQKEVKINDGRGIVSILKTATSGNIDTYTITYTDDTTSTFEVTNGIDGTDGRGIVSIEKTGTTGLVDIYTITYTDNTTSTFNVANGKGITKIEKISTNLLVDTYKITFNDGTTQDYEVTNGKGIVSIEKTSTEGLTDIYTITYNDETTATFNVVNGKGIVSIEKTSTSGYVDTYTITYNDGTTTTYEVTNGEVSQAQLDALQDELNYYKTIVNALPKITGSGTSITLNNTADSILSNVLNPNLSQDTTTGKNLCPVNSLTPTYNTTTTLIDFGEDKTFDSITLSFIFNGSYSQVTNVAWFDLRKNDETHNYLSPNTFNLTRDTNYTNTQLSNTQTNITFRYLIVYFMTNNYNNFNANSTMTNIMLSTSGGEYEPYTGGIPAPNPDFPMNIHTISGDNTIIVYNQKFFITDNVNTTKNGTTLTIENGNCSIVNTPSSSTDIINIPLKLPYTIQSGDYLHFRNDRVDNCSVFLFYSDGTQRNPGLNVANRIFSLANDIGKTIISIGVNVATTFSGTKLNFSPVILQSSTAIDYEENQEQTAQVNLGDLEYSKIGNYADVFMKPSGKNKIPLIDGSVTLNGLTITINGGEVIINGTATASTCFKLTNGIEAVNGANIDSDWLNETIISDKNNNTFSIKYASGTGSTSGCAFRIYTNSTTYLNQYYPEQSLQSTTYNTSGKLSCLVFFTNVNNTFTNYKFKIQLESGNSVTDWEPNNNGKWYLKKNIDKLVLDGSSDEDWGIAHDGTKYVFYINMYQNTSYNYKWIKYQKFCDNFTYENEAWRNATSPSLCENTADGYLLIFRYDDITSVADWRTFLSTHNTQVYYVLATPTYTLLNDTLQSQLEYIYNQMLAYKGQTNISQINNDLPFIIDSTALKDLTSL